MLAVWRTRPTEAALALAAIVGAVVAVVSPNGMAVVFGLTALVALVAAYRSTARLIEPGALAAVLAAGVVWMFLTVLWSPWPANVYDTLLRVLPILFGVGVLVSAARRVPAEAAAPVGRAIIVGFLVLVVLVGVEIATDGAIATFRDRLLHRVRPNVWTYTWVSQGLVVATLMVWPAVIAAWRMGHRHLTVAALIAAALLPFTAAHYAARGAVLFGAVGFLLVWFLGRRVLLGFGVIVTAIVASAPLLPFTLLEPSRFAAWLPALRNSAMHRLYIWHFTAERVAEKPVLGWGLNGARSLPGGQEATPVGGVYLSLHPHNAPLQLWVELGPIGAALAIALVVIALRGIWRRDDDRFTLAGMSALFTSSFFVAAVSFGIWQSWWLGTLALLACWTVVAGAISQKS